MTGKTSVVNKSPRTEESKDGIDKCWHVAALAFFIAFFESATMRSTGFLYVGIMEELGVDRSSASWPVSLMGSVNDIGGKDISIVKPWVHWLKTMLFLFRRHSNRTSIPETSSHG